MRAKRPISKQVNQEAALWLAEREAGDMTAEDEARLAQWLAADPQHASAFERAQAIWHSVDAPMLAAPLPARHSTRRWFRPSRQRRRQCGLVTVLCRSPISLCHLGFEREWADAAQI